jgi:hypothetical protein
LDGLRFLQQSAQQANKAGMSRSDAYVANVGSHPREPSFEGRPLSVWLSDLDISFSAEKRSEAIRAIQQMGTNAVPLLVKVVISPSDPFKVGVGALAHRLLPGMLQVAEKRGDSAHSRQSLGVEGLRALGPAATAGIPPLADFLTNHPYPGMAADGLAAIRVSAVPSLIAALGCTNDQQKLTTVGAFQQLGSVAGEAMPHLKRFYDQNRV